MRLTEAVRSAFSSIAANALRSLLTMLGIVIGVMALITVIAVMSGFQREIRDRLLGSVAHVTVAGYGGPLEDWAKVIEVARADARVVGAALGAPAPP